MGIFKWAGKKTKKEKNNYTDEFDAVENGQMIPEKSMSPDEKPKSEEMDADDLGEEIVQGDSISIDGEDYLLRIDETRMEALLTLYRRFSLEEIHALLEENGVVYGISESTLEELAKGRKNYEEVLVAKGTMPKDGRDGYFEHHFNPNPPTKPIILPDDTVDYNVLGKIELVSEGQLLVTYHSAQPAIVGKDVLGNVTEAYEGKDLPPLQCKQCEMDEDACKYYSSIEGRVTIEGNSLAVTPLYVVKGNLDATTGNVNFNGDVLVQGNVFAGVTVRTTGNITVNGHVETANLFAGKDVILTSGMQGAGRSIIRARRNVMARFIEQTQVYAGNEVNTGALLNCEVEAGERVVVTGDRGTIIGGTTTAVELISAASIGNRASVTTRLVIGLDEELKTKMTEIDSLIEEYQENMMDAERTLERITHQLKTQPLTPELSQQKSEQMRLKISYQANLKEASTKRETMIDIYRRSADGKIVTSGIANAGCIIIINGVHETLHSELRDVTFKKNRQEIRIVSNKQYYLA